MTTRPLPSDIDTDSDAVEAWIAESDPNDWEPVEAAVSPTSP
jgi:hypothetical protein